MNQTKLNNAAPPRFVDPPQACRTFIVVVSAHQHSMAGRYVEGPRDPKKVKSHGYGFTTDIAKAWPFPTERQAMAKARIVAQHMSWGAGALIAAPHDAQKMSNRGAERQPVRAVQPQSGDSPATCYAPNHNMRR